MLSLSTPMEFLWLPELYSLVLFELHFQVMTTYLVCRNGSGRGRALHTRRGKAERIVRNLSCWLGWDTLIRHYDSLSRERPRAGSQQPGLGSHEAMSLLSCEGTT